MIVLSTEIVARTQFGDLCNRRGLLGTAVEVGVNRAENAKVFLDSWKGSRFIAIDPWAPVKGYVDLLIRDDDREEAFAEAMRIFSAYGSRVTVMRGLSSTELPKLEDGSCDFIYIDADHSYERVREDIDLSWPKIKPNGILAGHDYHIEFTGVLRAVDEFAEENNLMVLVTRSDSPYSWYCYKDQSTSLFFNC